VEIGEEELEKTLKKLCVPVKDMVFDPPSPSPSSTKQEDPVKEEEEVITLIISNEENVKALEPIKLLSLTQKPAQLSKPTIKTSDREIEEPVVDPSNLQFDYLFRDQSTITVREALTRLTLPDLREIARSMKVGTPTMRVSLSPNFILNIL
jgi:Fanconi-associated nuclease 1